MSGYVGAPYNFVPFYNKVVEVEKKQMENHDRIEDSLYTGEISYTIKAETPIFISDGNNGRTDAKKVGFARNERGEYIIPGSSIRGLIRNNVQILGLAGFDDDIDDYNLMYRTVGGGTKKERKRYENILGLNPNPRKNEPNPPTNVEAGYIVKQGGRYVIYKTEVETISNKTGKMNYYVLSERNIAKELKEGNKYFEYFENNSQCLEHIMKDGFREEVKKGRKHYVGTKNDSYNPGYYEISYEVKKPDKVTAVGEVGQYSKEGYLVCPGDMNEKKAKYIVPKLNREKEPITIPQDDVAAFQIDYNRKKTVFNDTEKVYFNLPEKDNEIKPVFYVYLKGRLYFGFTPRLRLFYDYSIKDGLLQEKTEFDYAKSLFGTISDKTGYKSKVSFTDALLQGKAEYCGERKYILAEPKPTSYLDYIKQEGQNGDVTTYNDDDFELRGIKQYWLHKNEIINNQVKNEKASTIINPLKKGSTFTGKVRFHNLTKAELGLLLWGIMLEEGSMMNIGKGKAYGYGVIEINDVSLSLFDKEEAYCLDGAINFNPVNTVDALSEYIEAYKTEVNSKINGDSIDKLDSIKTFFRMHKGTLIPDNKDIRYMDIDNREYQSRVRDAIALPSVDEVISNSKSKTNRTNNMQNNVVQQKKMKKGATAKAIVKDYQGKKVKFYCDGIYIPVAVENLSGIDDLNKKNMQDKLPKGATVQLTCLEEGENAKYNVTL